jgi:uncharacterized protein
MKKSTILFSVGAVALLALPAAAIAHVTLQPDSAPAGAFVRLDVRVPNEQDKASTNKVQVQFPDGFVEASYEAAPGWKVSVKKEKLAKPVTSDEGEKITEQVSQITWTGQGSEGKIGPGEFEDFGLSVQIPDKPGTDLTFKAIQTYDNGDVVRWIGAPDSEEPAPQVAVTAASGEEHGGAAEEGATGTTEEPGATGESASEEANESGGSSDDSSDTLSIIALVVGGLGLVTGGFALTTARRRGT